LSASQQLICVPLPDDLLLEWQADERPVPESDLSWQQDCFRRFHAGGLDWLFRLGFVPSDRPCHQSLDFWRRFAGSFTQQLARTSDLEDLREGAEIAMPPPLAADLIAQAPLAAGFEHIDSDRLGAFWGGLVDCFRAGIRAHTGSVESYIHQLRPDLELAGRVFFNLVENRKGPHPFAFLATYSTRVGSDGSPRHLPLKHALQEFGGDRNKLLELLATVYRAAKTSTLLPDLLTSGHIFQPMGFDSKRACTFLRETVDYERCGIRCRIPNWWGAKRSRVSLGVRVGDKRGSEVGLDALVSCVPELRIGDEILSPDEARRLLENAEGLVLIKNKWVELDPDKLAKTLAAYERSEALLAEGMSMREAMRMLLNPADLLDLGAVEAEVGFGDWLGEITRKLANPASVRAVEPGPGFSAQLRPYQQQGLNWLSFLDSLGLGPCLADDMGLGKTIQILAFLSRTRLDKTGPSLLVVPASLLGNWQDEIARFLPDLSYTIAHSSSIGALAREGLSDRELRKNDLIISTYGMVQRQEWLRTPQWRYVILDEAQAIKNPGTQQTKAIKSLKARNRLVLTGTPVENRLQDLWSLFDFLNPGLLGSASEFRRLAKRAADDHSQYARLRQVVSPYILRRLKTDKTIIDDLPDKVEMTCYTELVPKQVLLYRKLVADLQKTFEAADGIQRRGLVLGALQRFKQVCNHPDQYTGSGSFAPADSGKFARLREICATILEKRERVLVFTQFREMVAPIDQFLSEVFGHPGHIIHGGVSVKARRQRVAEFQETRDYLPYMVLSVKAAGVGLNLTRANHVIHFDRWWNPAVENQATDRAYRIGQSRNVLVHKFICRGTVEEKVDQMIQRKSALAEQLVAATGESWITEMDNDELRGLFTLTL
jgi:superfamily II DNA or RNA helicase